MKRRVFSFKRVHHLIAVMVFAKSSKASGADTKAQCDTDSCSSEQFSISNNYAICKN